MSCDSLKFHMRGTYEAESYSPMRTSPPPSNESEAHMSDDRTADLTWIDVHDDSDVWYWTHKFGVTKRKLVAAVREVGAHAEDVAVELDKGAAHKKSRRTNR